MYNAFAASLSLAVDRRRRAAPVDRARSYAAPSKERDTPMRRACGATNRSFRIQIGFMLTEEKEAKSCTNAIAVPAASWNARKATDSPLLSRASRNRLAAGRFDSWP